MKQLPIVARVRDILWNSWDPINLMQTEAPRDEYDAYAAHVVLMLSRGASRDEIARYLDYVTRDVMGLKPDPSRSERAASQLMPLMTE